MAIIAIFCDGTWNSSKMGQETHVLRLARACASGSGQKVLYFAGVGTGKGMVSDLGRWLSKIGGGLFGWGLDRNIKSAYLALCKAYAPGDKIMIFGFSRGAYTARSLVGLIRKCGILADPRKANVSAAYGLYRSRGMQNAPDESSILEARRRMSPHFATSQADVEWRSDQSYLVRISYLGVWDTVGALGIPRSLLGPLADTWNARYAFHDTTLSRLVESARHAVALDERRALYEPTLWKNLDGGSEASGLNRGATGDARPYQQVWFAGNHTIVGGSREAQGLAAAPLAWICEGAKKAGLQLRPDGAFPEVAVNAAEDVPDMYSLRTVYRWAPWLLKWRRGPADPADLHATARLRVATVAGYRPKSLAKVLPGLFQR